MTETTILITYAIGTTQYSLLLSDLYDIENDSLNGDAISSILAPIRLYQNEIVEGWMKSQVGVFDEAILCGDINISLRCKEGVQIKVGKIAALSAKEIQVMARIKGFPNETSPPYIGVSPDDNSGAPKFMAKHNMAQFVHTRDVISQAALPVKPK
jgi:hypothetical protein